MSRWHDKFGEPHVSGRDPKSHVWPGSRLTAQFGVFQNYYSLNQLASHSLTDISWISSLQLCLTPLLGCVSGPLFDAGHLRPLIITGGTLYVLGLFMASISTEYYQFILAHGVCVGLGMGIMFSASVSTLSHHFGNSRWRGLVYGVQASGSSVGGIVFPIVARSLFPTVGFGWTVRVCESPRQLCVASFFEQSGRVW
jgi:MFS family permease